MNCDCSTTTCIELTVLPCATTVALPLTATETGTWTAALEFAGTVQRFPVGVTITQPIVVPNHFNEAGTHTLRLYKNAGALFAGTCYTITTKPTYVLP